MRPHVHAAVVTPLASARAVTDAVFRLIPATTWYERPVAERHRLIFYLGHVEAFDWNLLARHGCRVPSFHPTFDSLFAFGIDPEPGRAPADTPSDWPTLADVQGYVGDVRERLDELAADASPTLLDVAVEHRLMHAETFTYLVHNLADPLPSAGIPSAVDTDRLPGDLDAMIGIPEGTAQLGQAAGMGSFGWDNEYEAHEVQVSGFAIDKYKVTNGAYLKFVEAGAPLPHFWRRHGRHWSWRTLWGEIPLPMNWPVYVTHREAEAYARWLGRSLPTEAQFHRAAYGTPAGEERPYPWGQDPPTARHGNVDGHRWDPLPVDATPLGDSAFGVAQLVGNGWEWTGTPFGPFPGFEPFSFYPGYSSPFFDGQHVVLKGGSPRTAARLLRRSFRNWFRADYPYVYAGFRCVEN